MDHRTGTLEWTSTTEPEAWFWFAADQYTRTEFSTSTNPSVRVSKTPISFVEPPKRFFTPRRIR